MLITIATGLAYMAGASGAFALQRLGGVPVIWVASSVMAGGLLLLPRNWRAACTLACWVLGSVVYLWEPVGAKAGFFYNTICLSEAWLLTLLCDVFMPSIRLTNPGRLMRLMLVAVLPSSALASLATALVNNYLWPGHMPLGLALLQALPAKFLGMSVIMPSILILFGPQPESQVRRPAGEFALVFVAIAVLAVAPMIMWKYPAILVIFPAVIAMAFRYGPRPTVIAAFMLNVANIVGSVLAWSLDPTHKWALFWNPQLQQMVAAVFFTGVVTAMVIGQQQRLRLMLLRRSQVAVQARERALHASKAKTDFLATMSHELRTPMNSIVGFAQLLARRSDLPPEASGQVQMIQRSSGALLTIVDDILDFSKVEAGEVELSARPVRMDALVKDCLSIVEQSATEKCLALALRVDGEAGGGRLADDQRLRQVLLNLLNNAIKFTQAGEVRVELSCRAGPDAERVRFAVVDSGVGIAPEGMERLFKRFSQVDGSVTRVYGGTGLGLAICKGLVELMGGEIGAESRLGEGSTFWFEAPLPRAECAVPVEVANESEDGLRAHVLLVDDHPMNRELGHAVLELLGCTVDLAEDGEQAITAVQQTAYDVVLMDIHMPHMDGLEATRRIRGLPGRMGATPIIAMSADVLPEQVERYRQVGMVDNVGKPIRIETLHAALSRWIGRDADGQARAA